MAWIIIWENWFVCASLNVQGELHIPRIRGPRVSQTILVIIFSDLVAWIIIWENCICLFTVGNTKEFEYPKSPGTSGPTSHINYYALGVGGLDYHLGELNVFVCHWECRGNYISQEPRDPRIPNYINYYILWLGGLGLSFLRFGSVCLSLKMHKKELISQMSRDPGSPNHFHYYIMGLGGLDCHLGDLDLFVYRWDYKGNCVSPRSRDPGSPKPY